MTNSAVLKGIAAVAGLFLIIFSAGLALSTWLIMLVLGMIHSVWDVIPALGFWQSGIVALALSLLRVPKAIADALKKKDEKTTRIPISTFEKWSNN